MSNEISRMFYDPDTGLPQVFEGMSEEDAAQALSDVQFLRGKIAAKATAEATKQGDFAELKDTKLTAVLIALGSHQTKMETTHTNAEVIAAVLYLIKVMVVLVKIVARQI